MQDKETLFISKEIEDVLDLDFVAKEKNKTITTFFKREDLLTYCTVRYLKIKNKKLQICVNTSLNLIEKILLKNKVFFIVVKDDIEIIKQEVNLDTNLKINRKKNHSYNITIEIKDFKDGI